MKRFIRSIARTMGLAALVSLGGAGCRFDLSSLRKDGGMLANDSAVPDSLIQVDGSLDALIVPDTAILPDAPFQDAPYLPDAVVADAAFPDGATDGAISTDAGLPPCYTNDFNEDSDLEDLVIQNGFWERDPEGYLKQIQSGGGYRMAYIGDNNYTNLDAILRVKVPSGTDAANHTGLLFRYTRNSQSGYDWNLDQGYILYIEKGDGTYFTLTLEDAYVTRISEVQVNGGFDTWHTLRVRAIGDTITAYFNGEEFFTIQNSLYTSGHVGFGSHAGVSHFDDLEVCPLP